MISVNGVSVHFGGEYLFDNITFLVGNRDRIGLVGRNGAGKTTLLNLMSKKALPESGSVSTPNGCTLGYLPQECATNSNRGVLQEAMTAFSETLDLKRKIERLTLEVASSQDYTSQEYLNLLHALDECTSLYNISGGYNLQESAEKVLKGLGFEPGDFDKPLNTFSGGWQMRVELAKILLRKPDVVLLDEPTNHLDIESIQWLESYLSVYNGAVVLVSHDRAFLDKVTNRTIEIQNGRIYDYKMGYSKYEELRLEMIGQQKAAYDNQQAQIVQIERFIERFRYKSTKAKQVQSRVKRLEKMEKIEVDSTDTSAIHFLFPPAPACGKVAVECKNLSKSYGPKEVLNQVDLEILKGEFVAFVGKNGEGKTTLAKVIIGSLPYEGECRIGHNVKIGYYAQNQAELLDPEKTVFSTIDDIAVGEIRPRIRAILGSFLFAGDDLEKKVKVLSGGEKARLALARLLLEPYNLLVLDEPTNHLDMVSKDILKNALLRYDGALILVSHDRDFLEGLADKIYEFKGKKIKTWLGDIGEFIEKHQTEELQKRFTKPITTVGTQSANKINFEKRKQFERDERKILSKIQTIEGQIEALEKEMASHDALLADPETHKSAENSTKIFKAYQRLKRELEENMEWWEKAQQELDALRKQAPG